MIHVIKVIVCKIFSNYIMFYLIRHALSDFNEADNQLKKEHG